MADGRESGDDWDDLDGRMNGRMDGMGGCQREEDGCDDWLIFRIAYLLQQVYHKCACWRKYARYTR
jgi:hypothetical protein